MVGSLLLAFSTLLPCVLAMNGYFPPDHAAPEMIISPPNVTLMTPRNKNPMFEQQLFDFGSAQSGFSELKHILERQSCTSGYGSCSNDPGVCCPIGGRCCGRRKCCGPGRWCYGGGCCRNTQSGCDDKGCCDKGEQCCKGGSCCPKGKTCVIVDGQLGCCPIGLNCARRTCRTSSYLPCNNYDFCCPSGYQCYIDNLGNNSCRNPTPDPTPTPTRTRTPAPTPTPPRIPTPTLPETTEEESPTDVPPPEPSTAIISDISIGTVTQVQTQTFQASGPESSSSTTPTRASGTILATSIRALETGAMSSAGTSTINVGAIVGGVAAVIILC